MISTRLEAQLDLVTAPAATAISVAEAKSHMRIGFADDDTYITNLIDVATEWAQEYARRQLITATYDLKLQHFPIARHLVLPRGPLQSVTSVSYIDTAGVTQTLVEDTDFETITSKRDRGEIRLLPAKSWPAVQERARPVTVRFVAGYGDAASDVPEAVRQALLLLVATHYEHREAAMGEAPDMRPVMSLLNTVRSKEI